MVEDGNKGRKVVAVAREYGINLHELLHGWKYLSYILVYKYLIRSQRFCFDPKEVHVTSGNEKNLVVSLALFSRQEVDPNDDFSLFLIPKGSSVVFSLLH
ncbi:hypothetical protein HPP92_020376 [Vanilla planifolia]|uniref:Uncharacterized protein n=1 Tax=Vanilla planifolia TaxID=51239 RepID=A0A835PWY5_VANPL|nr:hypothetical protein HPP92_020376 [Vanilla planifolia]